ncbi:MAG: hypothetical protein EZS28_026114 [Streblomastix strix]|uniref:Uncharacterized protein n=1 Tax=Streblomastix strix TaxID=222440 RepID=A0A5J4V7J7_9EUKA|nr:MAG: hypothetical protein EZS28_026114 [Streblomastix strix]
MVYVGLGCCIAVSQMREFEINVMLVIEEKIAMIVVIVNVDYYYNYCYPLLILINVESFIQVCCMNPADIDLILVVDLMHIMNECLSVVFAKEVYVGFKMCMKKTKMITMLNTGEVDLLTCGACYYGEFEFTQLDGMYLKNVVVLCVGYDDEDEYYENDDYQVDCYWQDGQEDQDNEADEDYVIGGAYIVNVSGGVANKGAVDITADVDYSEVQVEIVQSEFDYYSVYQCCY